MAACTQALPATSTPATPPTVQVIAVTIYAPSPTPQPTALPPTPTPEPTPTVAAVFSVTATLTPSTVLAPNINPYTGQEFKDLSMLNRKPLLIKVANTAEVRPQSGLSGADMVFEHYSEGGITRFTALFLGNDVTKIGSVRSCRLIDIELPAILDAALVCSGTSPGVKPLMRASWGFTNNLTMISDFGPFECQDCPMFRTGDTAIPHNLFANTLNTRKELAARNTNQRTTFKGLLFGAAAPIAGREARQVELPYTSGVVGWVYEAAAGNYGRTLGTVPQMDRLTNKQLAVSNVIMLYAPHITTLIQEDVTGSQSIEIQLWGLGNAKIARDGRLIEGQWKRTSPTGSLELVDFDGAPIRLKPGPSWVQLLPVDFKESVR